MACERVDITVLVVDDDDSSLAVIASILKSWEYQVLTVNNAHDALETLREYQGFFDLVIIELHMEGVNGFELQKRVIEEFQLPVIMMSEDNRKSVMTKSLENGAAFYILKPVGIHDFRDIWQYAMAARKGKLIVNNEVVARGDSTSKKKLFQDVNSSTSSATGTRKRKKYSKRNGPQIDKEDQFELVCPRPAKKRKIVWTAYLHNLFLSAIKQIGLDRAVPKKILELMNVPGLTRENVASHLQKYRIFLRKVAEVGALEGLSDRALKSRFAAGLSPSMIKDIQDRIAQLRIPVQQYLRRSSKKKRNVKTAKAPNPSKKGAIPPRNQEVSRRANVPQLGSGEFPNPLSKDMVLQNQQAVNCNSLNQVRLGQSNLGSNHANSFHNPMLGSHARPLYQANRPNNAAAAGPVFPAYGLGHGLMTTANGLASAGMNYGDPVCLNKCSSGNQRSSYGPRNVNLGSLGSSNLPWSSIYYPSSNYTGIQLNGASRVTVGTGMNQGGFNSVGIATSAAPNNNSFGLINGTNNGAPITVGTGMNQGGLNSRVGKATAAGASNNSFGLINGAPNANVPVAPARNGNSGLVQGWSASAAWVDNAGELSPAFIFTATREENVSGIPTLPQRPNGLENAGGEHQNNANKMGEGKANKLEDDITELFLKLEDMHLLDETGENPLPSDFLNADFPSPSHIEQSLEQRQGPGDVIVPEATESSIDRPNEAGGRTNQLQGNDGIADWDPFDDIFLLDDASPALDSIINQDWDMEIIEALFGTKPNSEE